ncbi:hypothetical protein PG993_006170 [Apiospora rasikravindrae]|uniref:Uncharacterized protein n=1 Tax=Apiospora rasikravindrae TaxID=990691 RepID=A0ABR1T5E6_9PEZI
MYLVKCVAVCLLVRFVGAETSVPGAPVYLGAYWRSVEPKAPRVGGNQDSGGFLEALKTPNLTGTYDFSTPNISAPRAPGKVTDESNSALSGWSISIAVRADAPYRDDEHYTAGAVTIHTPESLLTNVTEGGQKNVSVLDEWELCVIQWDLRDEHYPPALRGDDGTCSSVLSPDCIRDVQTEARKQCSTLNITNIPACANDDTRAFRTAQVAGPYPARAIRDAEMLAFSTQPAPGGARNLTSYNDMGTVAWPMLLTLGDSRRVANWSGLFCVRPTEAVNGSTLPVWENKEEEQGGEGSGDGRGEEGQGDEEGAAMRIVIDRVFMFGLGAAALAYLMLW